VIELNERDHDAAAAPIAAPPTAAPAPIARRGDAAAAILECLGRSATPLGRAEILAETGITDIDWTTTIRSLVGEGRVIQEGQKRGTKYRLP
jgi:hypothetical protein